MNPSLFQFGGNSISGSQKRIVLTQVSTLFPENTMDSPKNTRTDDAFLSFRKQGEEEFAQVKANVKTKEDELRATYYELYALRQKEAGYNPHLYSTFEWKDCCLCGNLIGDDPYGHDPHPLCEGESEDRCCGTCNQEYVIPARIHEFGMKGNKETRKAFFKKLRIRIRNQHFAQFLGEVAKAVKSQ